MKLSAIAAGAAGISIFAIAALAHGGATGVVKERMDGMSAMADVMKALAPMMQGTVAYDADAVRAGAAKIAEHSGEALTSKFPEGTDGMPSEAKPEIWQDWDAFSGLAQQLEIFAKGLERAADNGVGGMPAQGGMMGGESIMGGGAMGSGMLGGQGMMGGGAPMMSAEHIGQMPSGMAFAMVSQACTACHTKFRAEEK
ncbi:c-type cytochrome [Tropicimonas marinistellae]|uniref:c-type cytochrome n=1 Tax=Tropicimonas marinistellae TaxID=1739787 RepID=UPI00082A65A4|nr:cytochrome c [Tropicimonas marinistellae]